MLLESQSYGENRSKQAIIADTRHTLALLIIKRTEQVTTAIGYA